VQLAPENHDDLMPGAYMSPASGNHGNAYSLSVTSRDNLTDGALMNGLFDQDQQMEDHVIHSDYGADMIDEDIGSEDGDDEGSDDESITSGKARVRREIKGKFRAREE
jgi:hypothetical protein